MSHVYAGANVSERRTLPPLIAVSTVIFALRPAAEGETPVLHLPLVRRTRPPYDGAWALPGAPLGASESLVDAAARTLAETTGLAPRYLEQLYSFGGLQRSPDQRVVSIVYWALVRPDEAAATRQVENVRWFPAAEVRGLAFDHDEIVAYALERLRTKAEYGAIAHRLLGERFTLAQLHEVSEALQGRTIDPANFRRQIAQVPAIEATDEYLEGGRHRPPRLYRYTGPEAAPLQP